MRPLRLTALVLVASLVFPRVASAGPTPEALEAKKAFEEGSRLFATKDYTAALEAFQRADFLQPHFLLKCNIARCHERMGKMVEAAESYRQCLSGGADKQRRMAGKVRAALKKVEGKITWVEVTSPGKGGTVFVNGLDRGPAPLKLALNPGTTAIEVRREGATPAGGTVTTSGGESQVLELIPRDRPKPIPRVVVAPPPPPPPPPPPRSTKLSHWWFWSATAITVGLAATATALGVRALKQKSDYEESPTREGYNQARDGRLLANIFWGATAAAAAGTTTLVFFTDFSFGKQRERSDEVVLGLGLRGSF